MANILITWRIRGSHCRNWPISGGAPLVWSVVISSRVCYHPPRFEAAARITRRYTWIAVIRQVLDNLSGEEIQQVAAGTALELDAIPPVRPSPVNAELPDSAVQSLPPDGAVAEGDLEIWATVRITADIELRARGLNQKALGRLRAIAEQLRQVVQTNQPLVPIGAGGLTPGYNERETHSLLTPLDDALL